MVRMVTRVFHQAIHFMEVPHKKPQLEWRRMLLNKVGLYSLKTKTNALSPSLLILGQVSYHVPVRRTSLSKFALVNSSEFRSALVAASFTLLLGSSFLIPWIMAVRISLDLSCSCSGS